MGAGKKREVYLPWFRLLLGENPAESEMDGSEVEDKQQAIQKQLAGAQGLDEAGAKPWSGARMLVPIRLQVPNDQAEAALALVHKFEESPIISESEST